MKIEVRDFQETVKAECRKAIGRGKKKILIQAPTGAGKTVIAAGIIKSAEEKGNPVLFFAHRRELIHQCADKLSAFGVRHGIVMAGEERDVYAGTQIASVDTFRARVIQRQRIEWPDAKIVFIDEAHRSMSPTYLEVIDHYAHKGSVVIGLSATPVRGDGRGLGHVYEEMIHAPTVPELIKTGYLVPPVHYVPSIPDLTGVRTTAGDYNAADLEKALNRRELIGDVLSNWIRFARHRKTIVFASGVDHSIALSLAFKEAGIRAAHIDANTPEHERGEILDNLRDGKIQVICNCMVLTEGFDEPSLSCVVLARPTKNKGLYVQMGGRGLRPSEGKTDCIVLDHAGCTYRHGTLDSHMDWSLDTRKKREADIKAERAERDKTQITCQECHAVYAGQLRCPMCGHMPEKFGHMIVAKDGTLVPMGSHEVKTGPKWTVTELQHWLDMFETVRIEKKQEVKWRNHRFIDKFGFFPSPEMNRSVKAAEQNGECRAWFTHLKIKWKAQQGLRKMAGGA